MTTAKLTFVLLRGVKVEARLTQVGLASRLNRVDPYSRAFEIAASNLIKSS